MKKYTFYKPQHGGQVYKCTPHTLKKDSVLIFITNWFFLREDNKALACNIISASKTGKFTDETELQVFSVQI